MSKAAVRCLIAAAIALLVLTPAAAMETRAGPSGRVGQGETIDDDLYVAAGFVTMDGRVRGDVVAAGGTVNVAGQVDGGLLAAGGTLVVSGPVGSSIRAVSGTIELRGTVGTDAVVAGGAVLVDSAARITRDLTAAGGNLTIGGTVDRNASLAGGRVEIAGTVTGNVLARAGEIVILPSAVIRGNLTYSSEQPIQIASGARIGGRVSQEPYPVRPVPSRAAMQGFRIAFGVFDFFWMLVIALVLVAFLPQNVQAQADVLRSRPWASLGLGVLLLVAVPVAAVALMLMIIGIPVAVLLLVSHTLALFLSHASAGLALGQRLAPRQSRYAAVAIGVAIIALVTHLPYVGWLLRVLAIAFGLGAVVLSLWARRPPTPTPYAPPHPGPPIRPPAVA
ncbi:MAG: bactofilin family protein [Armatimonadota bacterium]